MSKCIKCSGVWKGFNRCHCTGCHRSFNSVGAFDKHRAGMSCADPMDLGMVLTEDGYWLTPMPKDALSARMQGQKTRLLTPNREKVGGGRGTTTPGGSYK